MNSDKKIEILKGQISKLENPDFDFRIWGNETHNLLDLIFENSEIKKRQLHSVAQRLNHIISDKKIETLKNEWKKLIESYCYEISLLEDEKPVADNDEEFINHGRIEELKTLKSNNFDLSKLIKICDELNNNYLNKNYLSVSMLGRAIIDHIQPIFEMKSFNEVANNISSKSIKKNMLHLNNSLRNIADSYLHQTIRKKESLPNKTQLDFKNDMDVLLAEIIRIFNE